MRITVLAIGLSLVCLATSWASDEAPGEEQAKTAIFHLHVSGGKTGFKSYDFLAHGTPNGTTWTATFDGAQGSRVGTGKFTLAEYTSFLDGLVQRHVWTLKSTGTATDGRSYEVSLDMGGRTRQLKLSQGSGNSASETAMFSYIDDSLAGQPWKKLGGLSMPPDSATPKDSL